MAVKESLMEKEALIERVKAQTKDGRITCEAAQKIADETGVPRKDVGVLLNELEIKITDCQLGCFP